MPRFGKTSKTRLLTSDQQLQDVFQEVVLKYDCSIICGHRTKAEQDAAVAAKNSKVSFPNSKHNSKPSQAVDVAPYPINWGEKGTSKQRRKAISRFYHFAGYVLRVAEEKGITLRWGGDWDGDKDFSDQKFDDLVHWEIKR